MRITKQVETHVAITTRNLNGRVYESKFFLLSRLYQLVMIEWRLMDRFQGGLEFVELRKI